MGLLDIFKGDKKKNKQSADAQAANPNSYTGGSGLVHSPIDGQADNAMPAPASPPGVPPPAPSADDLSPPSLNAALDAPPMPSPAMPEATIGAPTLDAAPLPPGAPMDTPSVPQPAPLGVEPLAPAAPAPTSLQSDIPTASGPELAGTIDVPSPPDILTQGLPVDLPPAPQDDFDTALPTDAQLADVAQQLHVPRPHKASIEDADIDALTQVGGPLETPEVEVKKHLPPLPTVPTWDEAPSIPTAAFDDIALEEPRASPLPPSSDGIPTHVPDLDVFDAEAPAVPREDGFSFDRLSEDLKKLNQPLFVKMDAFHSIVDSINAVNTTLRDSDKIFFRLKELKEIKDKKLEEWRKSLEDIQRKLVYLDNKVFEVI